MHARPTPSGVFERLARALERLESSAATLAGVMVFAIMIIVFADVLMRYLFNAPIAWAFDLISIYLMAGSFYFALGDTLRRNHHVNVDIIYARFLLRTRQFWKIAGWALSSLVFAVILVLVAQATWSRWKSDEVVAGAIPWPTWIPAAMATAGFALLLARLVLGTLAIATALIARRKLSAEVAGEDVADFREQR